MLQRLHMLKKLLHDERGNVQSTEYILMVVLLAIGGVVGLATLRDQVSQELADTAVALEQLDQSYSISIPGYSASYSDNVLPDNDPNADPVGAGPAGMMFNAVAAGSEKTNAGSSDGDSNN